MKLIQSTFIGALLTLSGCASYESQNTAARETVASQREIFQSLSIDNNFSILHATPINRGLKSTYALNKEAAAIELDGEVALYLVFKLPPFTAPYFVEILPTFDRVGSNVMASTISSLTLLPGVSYLDENGVVIKSIVPKYNFDQDRYFSLAGEFGYPSICDDRVRYLAVHGVPATYGVKRELVTESYSQYGTMNILNQLYYGAMGDFRLGIPEKAVGKQIFGSNNVVLPCQIQEVTLSDFSQKLRMLGKGKPKN